MNSYFEPPCNNWEDYVKPKLVEEKLLEICKNIAEKKDKTHFSEVFDHLYEYISDNIENFID